MVHLLGATEQYTPASTPLHLAAAGGKEAVVLAILTEATARQQQGPGPGQQQQQLVDIRQLVDYRGA